MKISVKTTYCDEHGNELKFVKVDAGSFSHRVIVNDRPFDWLSSSYNPSKKTAEFFLKKHFGCPVDGELDEK